jgi:hypothetical protein
MRAGNARACRLDQLRTAHSKEICASATRANRPGHEQKRVVCQSRSRICCCHSLGLVRAPAYPSPSLSVNCTSLVQLRCLLTHICLDDCRQKGKGRSTVIEQIQREEEAHLKQALTTYVTNHGHKPMSQMKDPRRGPADGRPLPARRPVIATSSMGAPTHSGAENAAAGAAGAPSPETPTGSSR